MAAVFTIDALSNACNAAFVSAGNFGYLTLLSGDLATGLSYSVNAGTDTLTTTSAHGLVTGSRIRFVGGTLPTPLLANTDYFVSVLTGMTLKLATTLANAQTATNINLTDVGSGALTLTEQVLVQTDPLSVLLNKEVSHPSWTARAAIDNLGAALAVSGVAEKTSAAVPIVNGSSTALEYGHVLVLQAPATDAIGSIPPAGTGAILETQASLQSIAAGDARSIYFKLRARNA